MAIRIALIAGLALSFAAKEAPGQTATEVELLNRIRVLEQRLAAVEARLAPADAPPAQASPLVPEKPKPPELGATGDSTSLRGFAAGTTLNFLLDGYYEYNFNRPPGRTNLLRAYDTTANSFTMSQGVAVLERAPDPDRGRRFGMRLDLMFGQATESLSGSPANETRTAPYRNIYQAYGTYILPLGSGLTVDFGRFSSPIGLEGTFVKDQMNYTRSMLFTALPFYHMGVRATYKINDSTTASWMLVNGLNQMEDFNSYKSTHLMLSRSLSKNLSWTGGYYIGRETRDLGPAGPVLPKPDGRTHIGDMYLSWNAAPKLTLAGEGTYIVSRAFSNSAPSHVAGAAGYLKYQVVPAFFLAGRYEYLSDRGGYFSGSTQALKEATVSAGYQPAPGFQLRWEFRHDYSNQPYFPAETTGILKKEQNTALLGVLWWFGGKQGSW